MAKIYRITSTAGEMVYIGSTSGTLGKRWGEHTSTGNTTTCKILFEEYGVETCSIHLLEEVKEDERVIKERWWIENTEYVVNRMVPGRTNKEYYEANKEFISQRQKEYNEANKEFISQRQKEYNEANKEFISQWQKEYKEVNKESISQWKKQWYEANKEVILKKGSVPTSCPKCGKTMRRSSITKHLKTKHQDKVKLSNE